MLFFKKVQNKNFEHKNQNLLPYDLRNRTFFSNFALEFRIRIFT